MIEVSRIFPRQVIPDPILWRAMICRYNLGGLDIAVCNFEDDRDWMLGYFEDDRDRMLGPESDESDWDDLASILYLLLVLMAQDSKHNLRPNDDYDAEDVESLLRVIDTKITYGESPLLHSGNISRDYCERVARFHRIAQINNPRTIPSQEVADPHTSEELVFCHVRDFWLSSRESWTAETPDREAYDATDYDGPYGGERT